MSPLAVVVYLDIFEHGFTHLSATAESLTMNALNLQTVEKALRTGVVVAVALGAHAAYELMSDDQLLVNRRAILAATIAIYDHALRLFTPPQSRGS